MTVSSVLHDWKSLNLPWCLSLMPTSWVSLSPSSCAALSSSPCNSLFSLCSPHNQVFFMLFTKVSCDSVAQPYSISSSLFPMSRLEETCPCLPRPPVYDRQWFTLQGCMYLLGLSGICIHFFTHSGQLFLGHSTKVNVTDSIFFMTDMLHLSVYNGIPGFLLKLWWNLQLSVHDHTGTVELQISPVLLYRMVRKRVAERFEIWQMPQTFHFDVESTPKRESE